MLAIPKPILPGHRLSTFTTNKYPPSSKPTMPFQPCRSVLARGRHAARSVPSCARAFSNAEVISASSSSNSTPTTPTPDRFTNADSASKSTVQSFDENLPRWSQTPAGMKAPVQMDFAKRPHNKIWLVNSSPERLDAMYVRLLGPRGDKVLPEELKWLAVTHKSFDQGRRGFNDRLAMMGKFTLMMEASKMIISQEPRAPEQNPVGSRKPFEHEQLAPINNLGLQNPRDFLDKEKMYKLAEATGLLDVLRWKPRLTSRLEASGVETVANSAIYAIVGAITLQHGSVIASEFARNKILARMLRGH